MKQFRIGIISLGLALTPAVSAQSGLDPAFKFASQPVATISSQNGHRVGQEPRHVLELMADKLDFSSRQKLALQKLMEQQKQSVAALHQNTELSDEEKSAQFHKIQQQTREQFADLLTPEQKREFGKMLRQ